MRHRDRELQTDPSSRTYNLDQQEVRGVEELEKIAVSRKPFRELSCNSNVRTNLVPEDDKKIMRRIVCVKLKDDIHNPGEMNGQIIALKEHVKSRYRLSDLIRAEMDDKMTSNLSKWIRTGSKKGDLEQDSYKILSQFYKDRKDLLYHTGDAVVACKRKDDITRETLLEYDMIEPSKSPWACGVVMAKKKGDQLRFCCGFRYLNSVTVKDAYPIPRIDESLSKLGDAKFFYDS